MFEHSLFPLAAWYSTPAPSKKPLAASSEKAERPKGLAAVEEFRVVPVRFGGMEALLEMMGERI